ncbi:immunoglobulin domain-containing protein [Citrobacter portucalensis]|uniref:immunoglobulin domain-containing protein n=1 Tax=Citrobacter portucalensis TaxID=1639133 RepID=UPI002B39B281|nr:immunoglobulin domain-containing protein [Citrobacter portucalensis]MEB2740715.1 immunoglobulin domain-containing protein [Citrobacter portucalensis]
MGSFFTAVDDPKNQRVFLYRANEAIDNAIYLDTDPTGTAIPFPDVLDKVDMGSSTNKAGFILPYKDGVLLAFSTDLPTTKALTTGTPADVTVVVEGGNPSYNYAWTKNGTPLAITGETIHFDGVAGDAGSYVCTVTDALGLIIVSATMVVTVT